MRVRIYQPTKTAMQSGRGNTQRWLIECEIATPRRPEPLMGWVSADDTLNQVKLRFKSKDEAVAFAARKGWDYSVQEPAARRLHPQNYMDNFRPNRPV